MFSTVMKPLLSPSPSLFRLPPLSSSLSVLFHVFPFSSSSSPFHSPHPITPLRSSRRNYIPHHASLSDHYLSCSVPEKPLRVAVLLSGGVDSSVALRLLHAAGHSCTAFYLKIWFQEGFENFWNQCPWEDDLKYAKHVCEQVGVPLEVVHLTDEYWERVVSYIIEEYKCGRTPNPDVLCNTRIKFGAFMDAISDMEYDYVASGHYAKVAHPPAGPSVLQLSQDMVKDQTYFLSHLSQTQLKRLLFPLGCVKKDEVRKLATQFDLPNKDRKDSQGICFLGKIKFSDFVGRHIGEKEGIILEAETGDFLGKHRGFWFYTIGQRQGLRLPGGPWYVVEKDTKNNVVFVSRDYYSIDKRRRVFRVGSLRWLSGKPSGNVSQLRCKVRHGPGFYSCSFEMEEDLDVRALGRLEDFLRNKKVFIVLDNVTKENQIKDLIGPLEQYRKGSRIVITTRDKKLLQNNTDATYLVPRLNDREAMELFSIGAFPENLYPTEEFLDLSNKFVYYAKGHPSALKLLGSGLCQKEKTYWMEKWERLRVTPDKEIQKELKRSYEELDDEQRSIFLDIACFFRSEKADFVSSILKSDRVNAAAVMRELEEKCLVTISYNRLEMHDLMHAMAKEIGCESSIRRAGKRSRLWNHKDIRHVLEQRTGTECVRGIFFNMSNVEKIKLSPDVFMRMSNLKFLKFHNSHCSQWCDNDHKFQFCEGLDHFPDELVYLHWQGYPYNCLPSEFNPEELVYLNLRYSHIKQLWETEKNTENLRWADLSHSKGLLNLSGLSKAKNLERLDLESCTSLAALGSSIEQMNKLIYLNLRECTSLESLPEGINLKSLKTLILSGCSNLQKFQIISENIESLYLEGSAIEQVVEQIESLCNLILLNLKNCRSIQIAYTMLEGNRKIMRSLSLVRSRSKSKEVKSWMGGCM